MNKALKIREARESDCQFILGMIHELAAFEKLSHEVLATELKLKEHLFSSQPVAKALIAELNGVAVAFALYFFSFSTFLAKPGIYLEDLYVKESFRSKGIGLSLLKHLALIAQENNFGRLEWSVLDWNQKAIDFYLKLGAKPMDEWTVYRLNEDAISKLASRD